MRLFEWIATLIQKRPVKVLFITTLIFILMISGARQIRMATGNDTLVKTTTDAYQSNVNMEKDFGGESVIVLFEGEQKNLLSLENIRKMRNVETAMNNEDHIFSIMSPATIVHQISDKQSMEIKDRVKEISDGLAEMSKKMIDLGNELNSKDVKDPKELQSKINELSQATEAFDKLIVAQQEMGKGTVQLQAGMSQIADGLGNVSMQLQQMGKSSNNPQLNQQLTMMAQNIEKSAKGLDAMADKTSGLKQGTDKTSEALAKMKTELGSQTKEMAGGFGDVISPGQLKDMANGFLEMGEKLGEISDGLNTFYEKSGMMVADIPIEQKELNEILYEDGKLRTIFSDVVIDQTHTAMIMKLDGNLNDTQKDAIYQKLNDRLDKEDFKNITYFVSGKPVLDSALRTEMQNNMKMMVMLAVGVMLLILMAIFKVRWRILPLITVFIAVIGTLGVMGTVSIPMTMVSMAVFPILIGLGIDYSIQFQSRYQEEKSIKKTLRQMGPAVGIAVFATVLGFIALYTSPVPMVQDFGNMLTIGVIVSYLAGIFLLMPILYIRDRFFSEDITAKEMRITKKGAEEKPFWLEKALGGMTTYILKFSVVILLVSVLATGWGIYEDGKVGVQTDIETFMPQDTPELKNIHTLRDILGSTDQVVLYLQGENVLSKENLEWIDQKTEHIKRKFPETVVDTKSISTIIRKTDDGKMLEYNDSLNAIHDMPKDQRKIFVTEAHDKAIILVNIKHLPVGELEGFTKELKKEIQDAPMNVKITGKSVLDIEMINGLTSGRIEMTLLGMGLLFVGLLLVYRNPFKAFIPVFPISLIVGLSGGMMYLFGLKYTPLTATLGALILGIGTEMTILLLERYMEERKKNQDKREAMRITVSKIGVPIIASGVTTIGGFSVLMISDFVILKDFGFMTVINLSLALFSTLVVLPPVIVWLDRWIISRKTEKEPVAQIAQK